MEGRAWPVALAGPILYGRSVCLEGTLEHIQAALKLGKSRTGERHRGKGLQELKTVVEVLRRGWLHTQQLRPVCMR